jgi:protein transport protein SEC31
MALQADAFPVGLIAGGMMDGNIHIWDPARLSSNEQEALLASVEQHQGAISGLQFNPHKESSHLLASGGSDGEVFVMSLDRPDQPNVFVPAPPPNNAKHTAPITKVAWNSQVAHIMTTSAQNGICYVWDLRQKKAWYASDPSLHVTDF